jgi:hypothetical protein
MLKLTSTLVMTLLAGVALAQVAASAIGDETAKAADQGKDKTETTSVATAEVKKEEFVPPPGFRAKKRGDKVVYCKQDVTVGTRFKTEKCYDEAQIRDLILMREQNNRDFDQRRAICSNPAICAPI